MKERIAIIDGGRTPFCRARTSFKEWQADDLCAFVLREILQRIGFPLEQIDEVVVGNGVMPAKAANIARVAALKAGIPESVPAYSVQRNCASGMEALTTAADKISAQEATVVAVAATESMTNIPLMYNEKMTDLFSDLSRAKGLWQKLRTVAAFRPSFLAPEIGLEQGLTDPVCGLNMGLTAENLSKEFKISRLEQDQFALQSHKKAALALRSGRLAEEIVPIPFAGTLEHMQIEDNGIRSNQTIEALQGLKPYFDKLTGTVTAGNASQVTDGAAAMLVTTESHAKKVGLPVLGYLRSYAYAGLDGSRMGLGPVFATAKLLDKTGLELKDFQLIELNEAFAAQVLACQKAFASKTFANQKLKRSKELGEISDSILNVNGGAIALGHPIGASGARLVITLLKELRRRKQNLGLATLCIGGGQGAALALEVE